MKILYAASPRPGVELTLNRFLRAIQDKPYTIRIAAYRHQHFDQYTNWTLDALVNLDTRQPINLNDNDNLEIYCDQIKDYEPDLIISDLETFTSFIADDLDIPLLQVSPLSLYDAMPLEYKGELSIKIKYGAILRKGISIAEQTKNATYNANGNFVYSHFGDLSNPPRLKDGFQWVRPYHVIGYPSPTSRHNIVATHLNKTDDNISFTKQNSDIVLFDSDPSLNAIHKSLVDATEYAYNLKNADFFINRGYTDTLADAFYNGKASYVLPNFFDQESIVNTILSQHLGLGVATYDLTQELPDYPCPSPNYNPEIKFLHELIEDI